jgi:genome maintenance exonuclease 1
MAHNYMHKTEINKGVIMMCSKDNYYQEFIVEGEEFKNYQHQWLGKVSKYYEQRQRSDSTNEETE